MATPSDQTGKEVGANECPGRGPSNAVPTIQLLTREPRWTGTSIDRATAARYNDGMRSSVVRSLVLVLSFHLALPPAWCCTALGAVFSARTTVAPVKTCCGPHSCEHAEAPAKKSETPRVPCKSPCCDREPTLLAERADHFEFQALEAAAVEFEVSEAVSRPGEILEHAHPPPQSIRLLHCVWLC